MGNWSTNDAAGATDASANGNVDGDDASSSVATVATKAATETAAASNLHTFKAGLMGGFDMEGRCIMLPRKDVVPQNPDGFDQESSRKQKVRSPNQTTTTTTTTKCKPQSSLHPVPPKTSKKKKKKKKKKVHYKDAQLPDALAEVTSYKDLVELETMLRPDPMVQPADNGQEVELYEVAFRLKGVLLESQTVLQLKKLCSVVGAIGFIKCNKFQLLQLLAITKLKSISVKAAAGVYHVNNKVPDNTKFAIINTVLTTRYQLHFFCMNNEKLCLRPDANGGPNNHKFNRQVFEMVADYVNKKENDNDIGTLVDCPAIDKKRHISTFRGMGYDPTQRSRVTGDSCRRMLKSILVEWSVLQNKIGKYCTYPLFVHGILTNVRLFHPTAVDTHELDMMKYCQGNLPVYYFAVLVEKYGGNTYPIKAHLMSFVTDDVFAEPDTLRTFEESANVKQAVLSSVPKDQSSSNQNVQKEIAFHNRKLVMARRNKHEWENKLLKAGMEPPLAIVRECKQYIDEYTAEYQLHLNWLKENKPNFNPYEHP